MTHRERPRAWLAGVSALTVAAATIVVLPLLPLLPTDQRRVVGPLLLATAVICLLVTRHQLRRLQRRRVPGHPASTLASSVGMLAAQAVGGPCDGQPLDVSTASPPPEIWLVDDSATDQRQQHHRYALERQADGELLYRYSPPS